jgi:cell division protein FtsI (penicillin-binding protein 3)
VVLVVLGLLFAVVASKVIDLQVVNPGRNLAWGEAQRVGTTTLAAERGSILDRNGAELAVSRPTRSVFVDPQLIDSPSAEAALVAPLLGLDVTEVTAKMAGEGRFAYLKRKVAPEVADQVEALGLPGVAFLDESQRYLPAGDSARSLLGAVDPDNNGISGLEAMYGDVLTGTPGELSLERNPAGRTIAVGDHNLVPAVPGSDVKLTIDRAIQFEAERLLIDQVGTTEAKGGIAIVTKPGTGEILAMANVVRDPETKEVVVGTNNAAVTTQYEPGSVMKLVTVTAALEAGLVEPGTMFNLPSTLRVADAEFGEAEPRGAVSWSVDEILTHSSNVGTIKIGQMVGRDGLYAALRSFGFAEPTAVGFPNESAGALLETKDWSGTSLATIAIGQGVAVTPLQMLQAYNVVANNGEYVAPSLVSATVDADGVEHPATPPTGRRVLSEQTSAQANLMLRSVVSGGTGQLAAIPGYDTAGKTGTAWKRQPGGGYLDANGIRQYQSTFVGFVPAEQPALSVYVMIDEPKSGIYTGGATAAPVFSKLGGFALRRLGIAPPATDAANGGAAVDGEITPGSAPGGVTVVSEDGRVRSLPTGTPIAPPPTVAHGSTSSTTTAPPSSRSSSSSGR